MEAAGMSGSTIIKAGSTYSGDFFFKSNRNLMFKMQEKLRTANGFGSDKLGTMSYVIS